MSSSNCCFLTCIQVSQEAVQVVWYSHLLKNFPQFIVIHTVKGFGIVKKAEIDVFLELSCFFDDPADVGNLIKKTWQEYTEELYKKDLHDPDNHDGVITHLEPDILECEVKWALESITMNKASGGDGISAKLFQVLKDDALKVLHSICQQIWKTQQWPQDWKRSVFIPIPKKGNAKNAQTTAQLH